MRGFKSFGRTIRRGAKSVGHSISRGLKNNAGNIVRSAAELGMTAATLGPEAAGAQATVMAADAFQKTVDHSMNSKRRKLGHY